MFNPVAWFIAKRYLFSKKSHSVINLISIISIIAVAVPVAAMIILLSVTNGFNDLVKNLNSSFDPNIRISLEHGGYFDQNSPFIDSISNIENVRGVTRYVETDCVISNNDKTKAIVLRGIDSAYVDVFPVEEIVINGKYNKFNMLIGNGMSYDIDYALGVSGEVVLYAPSSGGSTLFGMSKGFNSDKISISGIYLLDSDTDRKYAIAPLKFTQNLMGKEGAISGIGVAVSGKENIQKSITEIKKIVPEGFSVKNSLEQRSLYYAIAGQEKMVILIMLAFITIIASLTLVGAVIMMMIEKKEQMYLIGTMGGDEKLQRTIFEYQSLIMTFAGGILGILIGIGIVILQQTFGFVKIGGGVVLIDEYPVLLDFGDVIMVFITVALVGYLISAITSRTGRNTYKQ